MDLSLKNEIPRKLARSQRDLQARFRGFRRRQQNKDEDFWQSRCAARGFARPAAQRYGSTGKEGMDKNR